MQNNGRVGGSLEEEMTDTLKEIEAQARETGLDIYSGDGINCEFSV